MTPICRNKSAITPKWFNSLETNSSSLAIVTFLFLSIIDLQTINASFDEICTCCHSTNFFDAPAFSYTKLCKRQTKNSSNHRIFTKTHGNDQYRKFWTITIIFMQWKLRNITNYTQFLFIMNINGMTSDYYQSIFYQSHSEFSLLVQCTTFTFRLAQSYNF